MLDLTKLIENAERQLQVRNRALAQTLEEISLLEAAGVTGQAIQAARVKRDRQHNACEASKQLIDTLKASKAFITNPTKKK